MGNSIITSVEDYDVAVAVNGHEIAMSQPNIIEAVVNEYKVMTSVPNYTVSIDAESAPLEGIYMTSVMCGPIMVFMVNTD